MRVNERVSGEPKIVRVAFETAHTIGEALITLRKPFAHCGHTRTTDKGKEFTPYERIALALSTDFFFAHLYVSWERGEKRKEKRVRGVERGAWGVGRGAWGERKHDRFDASIFPKGDAREWHHRR
jgi:hypothetical protein